MRHQDEYAEEPYIFTHSFLNPFGVNNRGAVQVVTLYATYTGIPFAPNTDLGPELNAYNAQQKAIYQQVYAGLQQGPNADIEFLGGNQPTLELCDPMFAPLVAGSVQYLCNLENSIMPCT